MNEETPTTATPVSKPAAPTGVEPATSGKKELPAELKGWNWGAFFLSWIWGIAHRVWIALLALAFGFIPVIGGFAALAMAIVLGLKGNEWAWQNRDFASVEEFKKVQKAWAIWGLVIFVLGIILAVTLGATLMNALKDSGQL